MEILCFFAGTAFFYFKSSYALCLLGAIFFFRPKAIYCFSFLAAIVLCICHEWFISDQGMPNTSLIQNATLKGYITSIPAQSPTRTQFQLLALRLNDHNVNTNILLSCYTHCPLLHSGQYVSIVAKVKKPINLSNPGGFDYVRLLSSRHIHWIGTIKSIQPLSLKTHHFPLLQLREYLASRLESLVPNEALLGVFQALTLGLTHHIDKEEWDLFRRTGTTHLIDISGEHIALIAGLSYWLFKWLWSRLRQVCLSYPAQKIGTLAAICISFAYALIAGFSVPTQRSFFACSLLLLHYFLPQRMSTWQSWRYALFVVLLLEPHSVFMLGFYFSFIAVGILIIINQRFKVHGIRKMLSMQFACMFGLMPLSLYWFSYGSLDGLIANLIAIPWVSFLIVPEALLIAFLSPWFVIPGSVFLLKCSITGLLNCLRWFDSFALFHFNLTYVTAIAPLAFMLAMALLVSLPIKRFLFCHGLIIIASFFPYYDNIKNGDAQIDVLDVGQGLAIVVRTAKHVLLYDTGMKLYQGNDMGKLVIIPYLNKLQINHIDTIIISHPDLDHRGGLLSLEERYHNFELIVDDPTYYQHGVSCHQHPTWHWDDVLFRFFPIEYPIGSKNNHSCILQVSNRHGKILFTGDIEKVAEQYLIKQYGHQLESTALLVPHHGSNSSSSERFIGQVLPRYAIVSYGFDNRYHFPHNKAMTTYRTRQIPVLNTVECGMVSLHLKANQFTVSCYRNQLQKRFFERQ